MNIVIQEPYSGARRVKFYVPYEAVEWRQKVKQIPTRAYHKDQQLWSIRNNKNLINQVKAIAGKNIKIMHTKESKPFKFHPLGNQSKEKLYLYEQKLVLKGYSRSTVASYKQAFTKFLATNRSNEIDTLTKEDLEKYLYQLVKDNQISNSLQNITINALKFYYEQVLNGPRTVYTLQRPKRNKTLPNTLSEKEVIRLLEAPKNLKHKCILYLMYSAGLRISEVVKLRIQDIHKDEKTIFVKAAKGKKDRKSLLSEQLLVKLREYYIEYRPAYWLFEGQDGGQYSTSSIQKLFRRVVQESGITPWATPHILRHSFATHLMQNGVNLRYIQTLLGHASPKTTEIYTHVIKVNNCIVQSPLDKILGESSTETSKPNNVYVE